MSLALAAEHGLAIVLLLALVVAAKLGRFPADPRLSTEDYVLAALATLPVLPSTSSPFGGWIAVGRALSLVLLLGVFLALWLDALLFRIFTIELGTGGIGTVVWSALYRELAELHQARRFVRENLAFALFLPIAALGLARPSCADADTSAVLSGAFVAGTAWILATTQMRRTRELWALWAASAAASVHVALVARGTIPPSPLLQPLFFGTVAALVVARLGALAFGRRVRDDHLFAPAQVRRAFGHGRLPSAAAFEPRPEHRAWLSQGPAVPMTSPRHGALRGANVILVTLESVGRDHLAQWGGPSGAKTPFLDDLARRSTVSAHHLCISPNTNNAHVALYASDYAVSGPSAPARALVDAGYDALYLTAADTEDYGLSELLQGAGFGHVIDRRTLTPGPLDGGVVSDWALPDQGVARVAERTSPDRPFFLHVHTTGTHVPYRVVDRARFGRRDPDSDLGRFLDGVEEADAILAALFAALDARGLTKDALIIVSSDHGQAFGERGYLSHASAVIAPELTVPFFLAHPRLEPREVHRSSHFDVLPTVLDLLGVPLQTPVFGRSLYLAADERSSLLVWAGHPSRSRSSNFGLVTRDRKYMVDLVSGRCYELTWDDLQVRELEGEEKVYWMLLLHRILTRRGLG